MTLQVTVTASGRMSLPAEIRKRLGLAQGGAVYVDETPFGSSSALANGGVQPRIRVGVRPLRLDGDDDFLDEFPEELPAFQRAFFASFLFPLSSHTLNLVTDSRPAQPPKQAGTRCVKLAGFPGFFRALGGSFVRGQHTGFLGLAQLRDGLGFEAGGTVPF